MLFIQSKNTDMEYTSLSPFSFTVRLTEIWPAGQRPSGDAAGQGSSVESDCSLLCWQHPPRSTLGWFSAQVISALNSSFWRRALNRPPLTAGQLSGRSLSAGPLPWNTTVSSVMVEWIIRNGVLAGSWMLITIGTFGALKPKSVVCCDCYK